jgi:hypothetical protein
MHPATKTFKQIRKNPPVRSNMPFILTSGGASASGHGALEPENLNR